MHSSANDSVHSASLIGGLMDSEFLRRAVDNVNPSHLNEKPQADAPTAAWQSLRRLIVSSFAPRRSAAKD